MSPKVLILGKNGQLGSELMRAFAMTGKAFGLDLPEVDYTKLKTVRDAIQKINPQVIINAAAYTDVDKAESEEQVAFQVNALACGEIAEQALKCNAAFIHISTDYVFDGSKGEPYVETDLPNPINAYGKTKLAGEGYIRKVNGAFLILRTAWLYSMDHENFVTKVIRWSTENHELKMVIDQTSNPTWARSLAQVIHAMITRSPVDTVDHISDHKGIYHLVSKGYCNRFIWAKEILRVYYSGKKNSAPQLHEARSTNFGSLTSRPLFSALDSSLFKRTFGMSLPDWKFDLGKAILPSQIISSKNL